MVNNNRKFENKLFQEVSNLEYFLDEELSIDFVKKFI